MRLTPFVLAAGAFFAWKAVNKGYGLTTLNYFIYKVEFGGMDGIYPLLYITIAIQNPSNASYEVKSFSGTLFGNNNEIGNASTFQPTQIPANSQSGFKVAVRLRLLGVVSDIISIIQGGSSLQVALKLNGTINVDNVPIPVSLNYKVL